jgi:hypothetical protein
MATFVSQPSLPGTENSGSSASDAGPAAAIPTTVRTIQIPTTERLLARTQRVSDDTGNLLDGSRIDELLSGETNGQRRIGHRAGRTAPLALNAAGLPLRRAVVAQGQTVSRTWVRRMLFPEGSRKEESMP